MSSETTEKALEACIERALTGEVTGSTDEAIAHEPSHDQGGNRWKRGKPGDFNAEFAIDEAMLWRFLETTQAQELAKLQHKPDWKRQVLERLHRKLKKDGILTVLKKGLDVDNAHLDLLYRLPYNDLNPEVKARFESNLFSVTRQVHYSVADPLKSVDMVLCLNGLALVTLELKNPWTGQNVNHAKKQYREDRDPNETIFQFRRCLVHFALDPDEAWMTTKVDGADTYGTLPTPPGRSLPPGLQRSDPTDPAPGGERRGVTFALLPGRSIDGYARHHPLLSQHPQRLPRGRLRIGGGEQGRDDDDPAGSGGEHGGQGFFVHAADAEDGPSNKTVNLGDVVQSDGRATGFGGGGEKRAEAEVVEAFGFGGRGLV